MRKGCGIVIIGLSLLWANCFGATYYCSVAGAGSHNGTSGNEWTLAEAMAVLDTLPDDGAGDTVYMDAGTYAAISSTTFAVLKKPRTDWLTFRADAGETVVTTGISIDCYENNYNVYLKFVGLQVNQINADTTALSSRGASYIYYKNLTCQNLGRTNDASPATYMAYMYGYLESPALNSDYITFDSCTFDGYDTGDYDEQWWGIHAAHACNNITITGCTIREATQAIYAQGTDWLIDTTEVTDCNADGIITATCTNLVIQNCSIHDLEKDVGGATHVDLLQFDSTGVLTNVTIRRNRWYNSSNQIMLLKCAAGSSGIVLENNLCYGANYGAAADGSAMSVEIGANTGDIIFRNNTVLKTTNDVADGVIRFSNLAPGSIKANICYGIWRDPAQSDPTNTDYLVIYSNVSDSWDSIPANCVQVASEAALQAQFNNWAGGDYTLASDSTAIDMCLVADCSTEDLRGYTRDANPDAGCYEYGAVPAEKYLFGFSN